jgi:hypothetical protein
MLPNYMRIIYTFLFVLCFSSVFSQTTIIYDGNGNVISGTHIKTRPGNKVTLTDSATKNTFVLDAEHIFITAYDKVGGILWKTDPWKDAKVEVYRTNRPIIVNMTFDVNPGYPDKLEKGDRVIWIECINTQFGYIDLKTGKFYFMGQD